MTRILVLKLLVVVLLSSMSVCVAFQLPQPSSTSTPTSSRPRRQRCSHYRTTPHRPSFPPPPHLQESDEMNDPVEVGRMVRGLVRTGMKDVESLQVGDLVVAKVDIPSLQIWRNRGYEITAIYAQGINVATGTIEQIPLPSLVAAADHPQVPSTGYTRYLQVYSAKDHSKPVIVTPEEIGLVTVKAELQDAMLLAIPGFFWVFVASSFSNYYTDRYGGSFLDAFFRT